MQIGIIGCGWLGERLGLFLKKNYTIITTNRTQQKASIMTEKGFISFSVDFSTKHFPIKAQQKVNKCDVLIISISVRLESAIFENVAEFLKENIAKHILFFSTVGIYENTNKEVDENTPSEFLEPYFSQTERFLQSKFPSIIILRLAGLFGDNRVFVNYFSNRKRILPNIPVNHIHYKDICLIIEKIIKHKKYKKGEIYNLVAPKHPLKLEVIKNQSKKYEVKVFFEADSSETDFKIVSSHKLVNDLNYEFLYSNPSYF